MKTAFLWHLLKLFASEALKKIQDLKKNRLLGPPSKFQPHPKKKSDPKKTKCDMHV